jgi:glucose/arabinose dehydrogenase
MTKIKLRWLWVTIAVELAAISGLVIWAQAFRQAETPAPVVTAPVNTPTKTPSYKTPAVTLAQVAKGVTDPVGIVASPVATDTRLYIIEQGGVIRTIKDKALEPEAFLDIKSRVQSGGEMGLLGFAFDPKVATSKAFYVNYTDHADNTIVARYKISDQTGRGDPSSEKILLKVKQPFANHNGGNLAFGPDGYLYIGMGDGGSGGDPDNRSQNMSDLLGKMLRLDVQGDGDYKVPTTNPFAKTGGKPEIWASGLRNPWRFSFDRKTGDLYIADVGQGDWEEISVQLAASKGGENYGWRCYEGSHAFKTDGCPAASSLTAPIIEYDHSKDRCSVTGGFVYRGSKFPALDGKYFYADYCTGEVFYSQQTSGVWNSVAAADASFHISTFGQDNKGEVYLADYDSGTVYQITDTAN